MKLKYSPLALILIISLMPPAVQQIFDASSYSQGMMLGCIIILIGLIVSRGVSGKIKLKLPLNWGKYYLTFILLELLVVGFNVLILGATVDFDKFIISSLMLWVFIFSIPFYLDAIELDKHDSTRKLLNRVMVFFIIIGILGIFKMSLSSIGHRKPVVFYTEASHYALGVGPFLYVYLVSCKKYWLRCLLIFSFFGLSFLLENSTLLLTTTLASLLVLKKRDLVIASAVALLAILLSGINFDYYSSRLPIYDEENNANLSYLQGVEEATLAILKTYGLGLGFQQFGIMDPQGLYAQIGYAKTGVYINRFEGSLGGAKVAAEFGVMGLIFLGVYLYFFIKYFIKLRRMAFFWNGDFVELVGHSFFVVFFIYLFVRGGGYFGPSYFYFFTSIFILQMQQRRKNKL